MPELKLRQNMRIDDIHVDIEDDIDTIRDTHKASIAQFLTSCLLMEPYSTLVHQLSIGSILLP